MPGMGVYTGMYLSAVGWRGEEETDAVLILPTN